MPESQLSLTIDDLKAEIGHYLGYGRGTPFSEGAWDTYQTNNINALLKSGLSQVYTPPAVSQNEPPHSWSFLRPIDTIILKSGDSQVILPDGFGGFEEPLHIVSPTASRNNWTLRVTQIGKVEQMHAMNPSTTGAPRMACEKVAPGTSAIGSTRSYLYVWPTADADYTLTGVWKHLQSVLTGSFPYPPGGSEHSELFKASCIYAAALQVDDDPEPRRSAFMERLSASIHVDRKRKGQYLGYNGDSSDGRNRQPRMPVWSRYYGGSDVTYNGDNL
jgi:hypothetical protein